MRFRRHFLIRRQFDAWLLTSGFAALALVSGFGKFAFGFFVFCGVYLSLRRRAWRHAPPAFTLALLAWALWQIGLSLARGEPVAGNRVLSYGAIELAVVFLPLGICLVSRPMDRMVAGARIGLLLALVLAPAHFLITGERVGLGVNEAIFAVVAGIIGLAARLPSRQPLRFLPDGRFWSYLALVPILLSGTRGAWVLVLLLGAVDGLRLFAARRADPRRTAILGAGAALGFAVLAIPLGGMVIERAESGIAELRAFEATGAVTGSADVRLVMWSSALRVLASQPLTGVGSTERMERVAALSGANDYMVTYYRHLHNLFLDEALSSGLVGLALMMTVFAAFLAAVLRGTGDRLVRETAVLLLVFIFAVGSFHGVLINEWTLITLFGTMSVMLTDIRRQRRRRSSAGAKG